ncbi:hypothetical protein ACFQ0T_35380 [Kitasatospora gansuensis]
MTGALLVYFGGYALWTGSRLLSAPGGQLTVVARPTSRGPAGRRWASGCSRCC